MEVYAYIKEVNYSALHFSIHASVHKVVFKNFIYFGKNYLKPPHKFGFSRGSSARSVSLSWGAREVGSPCEWRGGARHCSRAMVGESGLETC